MPRKSLALRAEEKQTGRIFPVFARSLSAWLVGRLHSEFKFSVLQGHQVKNAGSFEEADPEEHMLFMFEKRDIFHYIW